jgi:hypothetical protein
MNRKHIVFALLFMIVTGSALAQGGDSTVRRGFRKEKLFTGGSLSLSFGNQSFLAGVNPVIGYSLTSWADAGLAINYTYASYRDYNVNNDKLRQYIYGGGPFLRLFPVKFLFAQGQLERNMIKFKYLPPNGGQSEELKYAVTSFLAGAGYTTGRDPDGGSAYGYFAVMFDLNNDARSPYRDGNNRAIPIIRAGVNIPLFGRHSRDRP